jgi:hypothetical protein
MTNCIRCGRPITDTIHGAANLCPECRAAFAGTTQPQPIPVHPPVAVPSRQAAYRPPVTVAIVGINVLVFVAMVLNGVSPMGPTEAQLLRWVQTLARCPWADNCGGSLPPTMCTSGYFISSSTCGVCGTLAVRHRG